MSNASKSYFAMAKGLNTEAPLINFPDGYTTDEVNYELTIRGERRRRLGLALEAAGEAVTIDDYAVGDAVRAFDWENVAGIATINFIVMQVGFRLFIFNDASPLSPTEKPSTIDLRVHGVSGSTDVQISQHPLEAAFGRGHLFLFGKYTTPIYIEYDPAVEVFTVTQIQIKERDFQGEDDGYSNTVQPSAFIDSHVYNLKNRGWTQAFIDAYFADQALFPSKAMPPWLGLARTLTAGNSYNDDGVRTFVPDKLTAEYFQDASAPFGHFIINPFDTTLSSGSGGILGIVTWTEPGGLLPNTPFTMTIETAGVHGLAPADTVTISGLTASFIRAYDGGGIPQTEFFSVEGSYTVTSTPDTTHLTVSVTFPNYPFVGWYSQYLTLGNVYTDTSSTPTGTTVDFRPKAGTFFAGRVWYAGIDTARLAGRVYFSQVIEADSQYAKCYQVADPTDERISDLVPSDGGVIVIPEASNVLKIMPFSSSLLVFASNGVWQIGPGELGYFAATSYSVRKITDSGAVSPGSIILVDNLPIYWSTTDIFAISQDPRTGYLLTNNLSEKVINTFYNSIPLSKRRESTGVYDDLAKRIVWFYGSATSVNINAYDCALVYDLRMGAFVPYRFAYSSTEYVTGGLILKEAEQVSKIKYLGIVGGDLYVGEASNYTDYKDFGISEPECYMVTGYDSLRDPGTHKVAPTITTYSRKTETGYGAGPTYIPIRPSSTQMRARWDWADEASASKWGRYQEIYRHKQIYIPTTPASDGFDDGIPLVVAKSQIRGKGRVLQLEFRAGAGKDSWIQGWKTNFTRMEQ